MSDAIAISDPGQIEYDLMQQLVDLLRFHLVDYDLCPRIETGGPRWCRYSIWSDGDILGTGECLSEAIQDAIITVRGWR